MKLLVAPARRVHRPAVDRRLAGLGVEPGERMLHPAWSPLIWKSSRMGAAAFGAIDRGVDRDYRPRSTGWRNSQVSRSGPNSRSRTPLVRISEAPPYSWMSFDPSFSTSPGEHRAIILRCGLHLGAQHCGSACPRKRTVLVEPGQAPVCESFGSSGRLSVMTSFSVLAARQKARTRQDRSANLSQDLPRPCTDLPARRFSATS